MKEQIYTIPVNEAYDTDCECPLCYLEKKLEDEGIDYALGAAMMEPDYRVKSNDLGFCNRHLSQMFEQQNKLSLALLLDTHLEEVRHKIQKSAKSLASAPQKSSFFKKSAAGDYSSKLADKLHEINSTCVVCEQINHTMERYIGVIFYMWNKDNDFKQKFKNSKGLCLKHLEQLITAAPKHLSGRKLEEFVNVVINKELSELTKLQEDIHKFTLKFDYRNRDMELGTAEDAPIRAVEKISGFLHRK